MKGSDNIELQRKFRDFNNDFDDTHNYDGNTEDIANICKNPRK